MVLDVLRLVIRSVIIPCRVLNLIAVTIVDVVVAGVALPRTERGGVCSRLCEECALYGAFGELEMKVVSCWV